MSDRDAPLVRLRWGGVLPVDKPAGVSSFAVVDHVRRALLRDFPSLAPPRGGRRAAGPRPPRFRVGHAGTLDPLATGLLLVLVGKGSRLAPFLLGLDKVYAATVRFGTATDSLDADGAVVATAPVPDEPAAVIAALENFRGTIQQVPPVISALKRDGLPLYKRARAGEDVAEPAARPVTIHRLQATAQRWSGSAPELDLDVACSSGTYVRSLARDIAAACGTLAHLSALRRLAIGHLPVTGAVAGVLERTGRELAPAMMDLAAALAPLPRLDLSAAEAEDVRCGRPPAPDWRDRLSAEMIPGAADRKLRLLDPAGELVAVGEVASLEAEMRLAAVFPGPTPNGSRDDD